MCQVTAGGIAVPSYWWSHCSLMACVFEAGLLLSMCHTSRERVAGCPAAPRVPMRACMPAGQVRGAVQPVCQRRHQGPVRHHQPSKQGPQQVSQQYNSAVLPARPGGIGSRPFALSRPALGPASQPDSGPLPPVVRRPDKAACVATPAGCPGGWSGHPWSSSRTTGPTEHTGHGLGT